MGFAQTGAAVDKQGVINHARVLGHPLAGGVGKFIARTDNEIFKGVFIPVLRLKRGLRLLFLLFFRGFYGDLNFYRKAQQPLEVGFHQLGVLAF